MEVKLFQSLEDRSINWGTGWGLAPDGSSLLAPSLIHRAPALQCISGQMPGYLDPGLVSNHQHVLALRESVGRPIRRARSPRGADCWSWWSLSSIIHYSRPAVKSGSHRGLTLNGLSGKYGGPHVRVSGARKGMRWRKQKPNSRSSMLLFTVHIFLWQMKATRRTLCVSVWNWIFVTQHIQYIKQHHFYFLSGVNSQRKQFQQRTQT